MHKIDSPKTLGRLIRATRKSQRLRQDDAAGAVGVTPNFLRAVERGKPTAQIGKVLEVLASLGLELYVDLPEAAEEALLDEPRASRRSDRDG